eukprot:CAMPEP_0185041458 /NCGR_PEP_ID=MMETSP1103-20130426/40755_1 /TAXON_ID=36769 /ORGANISM="Paraphysomonas bandaiensis, Strain Caron Lab Isolate" /LENGTH=367 /DNA_ID=CAMNT_0027581187 /DNA_START=247 /DNA_END=1350 /DNA_ORIENTATION=+
MLMSIAVATNPQLYNSRLMDARSERETWKNFVPIYFCTFYDIYPGFIFTARFFEEKYKLMMHRVANTTRRFACVQIDNLDVALVAQIREIEFLRDGRCCVEAKVMNGRYRIKDIYEEEGTAGLHYCELESICDRELSTESRPWVPFPPLSTVPYTTPRTTIYSGLHIESRDIVDSSEDQVLPDFNPSELPNGSIGSPDTRSEDSYTVVAAPFGPERLPEGGVDSPDIASSEVEESESSELAEAKRLCVVLRELINRSPRYRSTPSLAEDATIEEFSLWAVGNLGDIGPSNKLRLLTGTCTLHRLKECIRHLDVGSHTANEERLYHRLDKTMMYGGTTAAAVLAYVAIVVFSKYQNMEFDLFQFPKFL